MPEDVAGTRAGRELQDDTAKISLLYGKHLKSTWGNDML